MEGADRLGGCDRLLGAIESSLRFVTRILVSGSSRKMEYDLRYDVYAHIQSLDQKFFQDNQTGDLMARVSNDVTTVREMLGHIYTVAAAMPPEQRERYLTLMKPRILAPGLPHQTVAAQRP